MARTPTSTDPSVELLAELEADVAGETPVADLTARELEVAGLLRERDHVEGCPAVDAPGYRGAARIEAYAETVIAPRPEVRALGVDAGEPLVVARCNECGALRYFRPPADTPVSTAVNALLAQRIRERIGTATTDSSIDTTLE